MESTLRIIEWIPSVMCSLNVKPQLFTLHPSPFTALSHLLHFTPNPQGIFPTDLLDIRI